jgi:hypothetical protein
MKPSTTDPVQRDKTFISFLQDLADAHPDLKDLTTKATVYLRGEIRSQHNCRVRNYHRNNLQNPAA